MNLLKKFFSFSIGTFTAAIIGIISIPILTRIISPAEYGIATIFLTVGSLLSVMAMFGLDQAFVRFFYEKNRTALLKRSIFTSLLITSFLSLLITFFNEQLSLYISPKGSYALLITIYIVAFVIYRFSNLILRMMQYGYRYSIIQALQKVLEFIFILNLALLKPDHYSIIIGSIATMVLLSILSLVMSKAFWRHGDNNDDLIRYSDLLIYAYPIMISTFMALLFQSIDKFFLKYWGTSEDLGIYTAGFKLVAILNIIQTTFAVFWAPVSLEQYKKNPNNKEFFGRISRLVTLIMLAIAIIVIVFKDILVLFLGPEFQKASNLIPALVLMPIMYTMSEATVQGINFSLKTYLHIGITGIALLINILLSIILIPRFGMEGAAVSVGIAYVSFYFTRTYYGLKYFKFDTKLMQTTISIVLLVLWIIIIMSFNNNLYVYTGAVILLSFLIFSFKEEVIFIGKTIKLWLISYRK